MGVTGSGSGGLCCGLWYLEKEQQVKKGYTYLQGAGSMGMGLWELAMRFGGCRQAGSGTTGVKLPSDGCRKMVPFPYGAGKEGVKQDRMTGVLLVQSLCSSCLTIFFCEAIAITDFVCVCPHCTDCGAVFTMWFPHGAVRFRLAFLHVRRT